MIRLKRFHTIPSFEKKRNALLADFPRHERSLKKRPFTKLPWQNLFPAFSPPHGVFKKFEKIVVVGIGGSSLGAEALAAAFSKSEKIIFIDTVDPDFVSETIKKINFKKTFFLFISKSGETLEVLSCAALLSPQVAGKQAYVITDNKESSLGRWAKKKKIPIMLSPEEIPGRFSVLSNVGLFPASLLGIPWKKILMGAQKTSWKMAFELACMQYLHFLSGRHSVIFFPYGEALDLLGDWYTQLLAESIGKSKTVGITPLKALGVKDQHSKLQLFLDGPDDKWCMFFHIQKQTALPKPIKIGRKRYTLKTIFDAEYEGVKRAFREQKKPFVELLLPGMTLKIFGELLFLLELQVGFLGKLFKVNAENQPAVERSKKITKTLLKIF